MDYKQKLQFLVEKAGVNPEHITELCKVDRTAYYRWIDKGVKKARYRFIIDKFITQHRFYTRPAFMAPPPQVDPIMWLSEKLKFTAEEIAEITQTPVEVIKTCIRNFGAPPPAQDYVRGFLPMFAERREYEKPVDLLDNQEPLTYNIDKDPIFAD